VTASPVCEIGSLDDAIVVVSVCPDVVSTAVEDAPSVDGCTVVVSVVEAAAVTLSVPDVVVSAVASTVVVEVWVTSLIAVASGSPIPMLLSSPESRTNG
jgi:hypothetical protein